ncbi:MAG: YebC/PmpR family DNA-binding transcriptional regulator [Legionellales bacterium]|nr:YebC/PmpR family DNA-binding transcriptional regulator [Legionellales bacterium]
MAGHSKWANIQHRKNAQDAKRGKIFTKLIREITVAAKMGGGVLDANPRLRLAVDKALTANMTRDTIDRAIKRGAGNADGDNMEELTYEGYGPGGVAIMVKCLSDNRNRTVGEVRHAFTKYGGNLGTDGSVAYLFKLQGFLHYPAGSDENKILEMAIDAGAEDVIIHDDHSIDVITANENFLKIKEVMMAKNLNPQHADTTMVASLEVSLDAETAEKLLKLVDVLEDLDDVQNVFTNADLPMEE